MIGQSTKKSFFFPLSWLNISEKRPKSSGCPYVSLLLFTSLMLLHQ